MLKAHNYIGKTGKVEPHRDETMCHSINLTRRSLRKVWAKIDRYGEIERDTRKTVGDMDRRTATRRVKAGLPDTQRERKPRREKRREQHRETERARNRKSEERTDRETE